MRNNIQHIVNYIIEILLINYNYEKYIFYLFLSFLY